METRAVAAKTAPDAPYDLRCEYAVDPVGIDAARPRFSWLVRSALRGDRQSAYQILVAGDEKGLVDGKGEVWDSGRVTSRETFSAVYGGRPLRSGERCFWKVRWWNKDSKASGWSRPGTFVMGVLRDEDWKGKWIRGQRYFRKPFTVDKPVKRAVANVAGLGYYELRLNGGRVGDRVLDPAWTVYEKRVQYATYDLTGALREGTNVVGAELGKGRYIEKYGYSSPRLLFQLDVELADGSSLSVVTDESWETATGPLLSDDIYDGVAYDARLERQGWDRPDFDDPSWGRCELTDPPAGRLMASGEFPPVRFSETVGAVGLTNPAKGVFVYDFGQNFTGWARLRVSGPEGTEVRLRYSEVLGPDGSVDMRNLRGAKATDTYILKGTGEEVFEPKFTYHGFRFVEVTGFPGVPVQESLGARVFHTDVDRTGAFACSNDLINRIHKAVVWTLLSNLMSVPTDCPQRDERMGWLGDAQLAAELACYNFWMPAFYEKFARDIKDSQREDGCVPAVAPPYWKIYPSDPNWGTACTVIPWTAYLFYGDVKILEENYSMMKAWVEYLRSLSEADVIWWGKEGDWCPPGQVHPTQTPLELTSSFVYCRDLEIIARAAAVLGKEEDARAYAALAEKAKGAFNMTFLDPKEGKYVSPRRKDFPKQLQGGSQTCNVLPLSLQIVPKESVDAVFRSLAKDVEQSHDSHLNTGIVGTRHLFDVLTDYGRGDLAYRVATQESYPGYGYMLREGATTIWERWEKLEDSGMNSHNHIMFGTVDSWFYRVIAGIGMEHGTEAFRKVKIMPQPLGGLTFAKASVKTTLGTVSTSWEKRDGAFYLDVGLPVGAEGAVYLQRLGECRYRVLEGGKEVWSDSGFVGGVEGVLRGAEEGDAVKFEVASGTYNFELRMETHP
ncbi:MAG: family 78 glycoside hydrolase catalytic domain [Nitrososphaerota archaeon]|nr:family 78 glycoside hydrolase catalytic domain [Nitrososphaerota archaeon]MDG6955284.1 family 78 glycoside hydrolase catalytic domain [Nitrososphaerota archaeon]